MLHTASILFFSHLQSLVMKVFYSVRIVLFLLISPSFSFPPHINPVAYQQLLSQQRGLSAFGHTPPLIQPSASSFSARQHPLSATAMSASLNNSNSDANQVGKRKGRCFLQFYTSGVRLVRRAKRMHVTLALLRLCCSCDHTVSRKLPAASCRCPDHTQMFRY